MSTIKSSAEDLTINADGSGNDIKFQSNGSEVGSLTAEGVLTATSFAGSGASLTGLSSFDPDGAVTINDTGADVDFRVEGSGETHALFVDGATGNVGLGDSDPSDAKLSIDNVASGDAGIYIKQDQAQKSIHIDQNGNQDGIFIDGKSGITNRFGMYIDTDSLTSGRSLYVYDNSSSTTSRYLVRIDNDNPASTGCIPLSVKQDSTGLAADFSGTGGIRSAGGILFGTDTAAANALDDYEEGTWTPALSNMTVNGTFTSGGYYRVIGKIQHFTGWFAATTSIVWSASAYITGLPNIGILHNMSAVMNTGFAYHAKGFPLFSGEGNPNRIWIPNTFGTWQPGSGSGYDGGTKVRFGGTQPLA